MRASALAAHPIGEELRLLDDLRLRAPDLRSSLCTSGFLLPEEPAFFGKEARTAIRDHIATSLSIELDDLDYTPFNQEGGLGKAHQLFGDHLPTLLEELNQVLAA